mmetsp:Transcript_66296/g.158604  ORF Transcript_66296/g.158604 Transcript_66296/m.158604 type:complete len:205 (+) Transcript_66296:687-1301(+)
MILTMNKAVVPKANHPTGRLRKGSLQSSHATSPSSIRMGESRVRKVSLAPGANASSKIVPVAILRPKGSKPPPPPLSTVSRISRKIHQETTSTTTSKDPKDPSSAWNTGLSRSGFQSHSSASPTPILDATTKSNVHSMEATAPSDPIRDVCLLLRSTVTQPTGCDKGTSKVRLKVPSEDLTSLPFRGQGFRAQSSQMKLGRERP